MRIQKARALVLEIGKSQTHSWQAKLSAEYPIITKSIEPSELRKDHFEIENFDVVLLDAAPEDLEQGLQVLQVIQGMDPDIELIVTGRCTNQNEKQVVQQGDYRLVEISSDLTELAANVRHAASQRQKLQMMRRLAEVSTLINSSTDISEILQRTCQIAVRLFAVEHSGVVQFDPEQAYGWTIAEYSENQEIKTVGNKIYVAGSPDEEELVFRGKDIHIADVSTAAGLGENKKILEEAGIKSILIVPIKVENKVIASISLDSVSEKITFTTNEIELCHILAGQAAIAIRNAQLISEVQQRDQSFQVLFENSKALLSSHDSENIFQSVVNITHRELKTFHCQVLIMDKKGRVKERIEAGPEFKNKRANLVREKGVSRQVHQSGQPVFVADTLSERSININPDVVKDGVKACACLPLRFNAQPLGVVWNYYMEPHEFNNQQKESLDLLAQYIAMAYAYSRRGRRFMQSVTEAMAAADDLRTLYQAIAQGARDLMEADSAVLLSYDAPQDTFQFDEIAMAGSIQKWADQISNWKQVLEKVARYTLDHSYIQAEDPLHKPSTYLDPDLENKLPDMNIFAYQGIRLKTDDDTLGVLFITYDHPFNPDNEHRSLIEDFSKYAALTLIMARNLDWSLQSAENHREITQVSAEGKLQNTLKTIVEKTRSLIHCDVVTLYLHDPTRDCFFDYIGAGLSDPNNMASPAQLSEISAPYQMKILEEPWYPAERAAGDKILGGEFILREKIKSSAGMKLVYKDLLVGVMFVDFKNRHRFTEREKSDLKQFGQSAALAIYAHLTENERHLAALTALHQAGEAINANFNNTDASLQDVLDLICKKALEIIAGDCQSDQCFSHITLTVGKRYKFSAASNPKILAQLRHNLGEVDLEGPGPIGIVGRAIKDNYSQRVDDLPNHPDYICSDKEIRSQLSVPLHNGGKVFGVLSIEHRGEHAFTVDDQRNLELLAVMAGYTLQNNRRFIMLKSLIKAGKPLTAREGLIPSLRTIARIALEVSECQLVTIYTYNAEEREISYPFVNEGILLSPERQADWEKANPSHRLFLNALDETNVVRVIIETGESIFADNSQENPVFNQRDFITREQIVSSAGIPLKINNVVVGILFINYRIPHTFTEEEKMEISLFADYAAIAIETTRQYEELREVKGMVGGRTSIAWMSILRSVWRESISRYAINAKASITLMKEYIKEDPLEMENRELIEDELNLLGEDADQILKLPITPPLVSGSGAEKINLNAFIEDRLGSYERELIRRDLLSPIIEFFPAAETIEVEANEDWLYYSVRELLENAVQAVQACNKKRIYVTAFKKDRQAVIQIEDNGPGIPEGIQPKLFKKRISPHPDWDGLGIGLLSVKAILQTYGADISVVEQTENKKLGGACLQVTLPCV